jgi:hypothetical protein
MTSRCFFVNPGGRGTVATHQIDHDERAGLVGQRERGSWPVCQGQGSSSSRHRYRRSQTSVVVTQKSIRKSKRNHFKYCNKCRNFFIFIALQSGKIITNLTLYKKKMLSDIQLIRDTLWMIVKVSLSIFTFLKV